MEKLISENESVNEELYKNINKINAIIDEIKKNIQFNTEIQGLKLKKNLLIKKYDSIENKESEQAQKIAQECYDLDKIIEDKVKKIVSVSQCSYQ